ncbi:TPA: hypothetical protein ACH3X2_008410 [Trebouxia sp. C0005]|nr:MAG: hypothetical protein FRX49_01315 [Trebouxia sp. A1-2]
MPHWPHLASCPESFEDFADVVFVVGNERLPAHSQYLASYSKLMQALMRDSPTFSKDNPLVLDQQLQAFAREDIQTFLDHVYLNRDVSSSAEANALLRLADLFDAAKLLRKAVEYLEAASPEDMFVDKEAILCWLLLAERFDLPSFMNKCANHAAMHFHEVCKDAKFHQLGTSALKAVMRALHLLIHLYPGLQSTEPGREPYTSWFSPLNPTSFMTGGSGDIAQMGGSVLHVQQLYMCKATHFMNKNNSDGVCATCAGHRGTWSWNLQKQMWQLQSNQAVVTKFLPTNVLDLADLIGQPPCHTGDIARWMEW